MSDITNELQALSRLSPVPDAPVLMPAYPGQTEEKSRTSVSLSATLRRRWALILATWIVVTGGLTALIWTQFHIEYEAVGLVRVAPVIRPILFRDEESGFLPFYNAFMAAQMQNIKTATVLKRAVEAPEVQALQWVSKTSDPVAYLSKHLKIENPDAGEYIAVSMMGPDPRELAPTVNAVLRAYEQKVLADNQSDDTAQLELLYDKQEKLEQELQQQHKELYSFATEVGTLSLGDHKEAAAAGIQTIQVKLKEAQAARVAAQARLESLRRRGPAPLSSAEFDHLQQQVLLADDELASLNVARQLDEQRLISLSRQLGPDHRDLRYTRERVEQLKSRIAERTRALSESVNALAEARARLLFEAECRAAEQAFDEASQKERALEEVVRDDLNRMGTMGKNAVQLQALQSKTKLTEQLHGQVSERIQHLEVEKQRHARVSIDSWASEPTSPARDKRPKLTAVAIAAGLFMGLALALLVDSRDTFVRNVEDVRQNVGLTVLGTRSMPSWRQGTDKDVLATVAEEIRGIRGCVLFAGGSQDFRSLLITSPNPREGKTHTAGELAIALAESGRRVLLIDADNRKRDLTHQLGADDRPGLSELLADGQDPEDFILSTSTPGLSFLPAGAISDRFSELLVRPGQLERVRAAFDDFDLVLVDSPPVLLSNDACIWARYIDTVLVVLRVKHSSREDALAAKDKLTQMGGRIMGAVLNGVEHRTHYYSRYAYAPS